MRTNHIAIPIAVALILAVMTAWIPLTAQSGSTEPEARLARVFQDNMVLQRQMPVPIWGWAKPGTQVEVDFAGQSKQATANDKGYWKAILDPMEANATGQDLTAKIGSTSVTCKNVLVGEVWLSAGHSGTVCKGPNIDTGVYPRYESPETKGGKPEIRIFVSNFGASLEPYDDFDPVVQSDAHWKIMKEVPPAEEEMDQVQYFAQFIRDRLDVPVGILQPVCVGVCQTAWMSRETLEAIPFDNGTENCYQHLFNMREAGLAKSTGPIKSWEDFKKAEDAYRQTKKGAWPAISVGVVTIFSYPSVGYNTRVHPLAPYAMRGVQFFACPTPETGGAAGLAAMIKQWRTLFGQDFYFVNCASGYRIRTTDQPPLSPMITLNPTEDAMHEERRLSSDQEHEDVVYTGDLSGWMAHSMERAESGRRLGLATLALAYGQKPTADGFCPRMAETKIEGNKAIIRFDFAGDGMVYQPSIDGISGVYLRGKSGPGRWADVKVTGKDTIEVSSPDITDLETVAYGYNVNAHETLFNSAGMPAAMFIVNPPTKEEGIPNQPQPSYRIVRMVDEGSFHTLNNAAIKGAQISLPHVRRDGYIFQIVGQELIGNDMQVIAGKGNDQLENSSATTPVEAYIPAEWKGYEVVAGNKCDIQWHAGEPSQWSIKSGWTPLKTTETSKDGARFVTFDAPIDRTWVIVAEAGKAADFAKINRY